MSHILTHQHNKPIIIIIIMIACHILSRGRGLPQQNTIRLVRQWLKNKFKGWGI